MDTFFQKFPNFQIFSLRGALIQEPPDSAGMFRQLIPIRRANISRLALIGTEIFRFCEFPRDSIQLLYKSTIDGVGDR